MSLLFSTVTVTPRQGAAVTIQESGHPDEYDLRELLRREARYAPVHETEYHGAAVQVRLEKRGGQVVLTVEDRGPGIPEAVEG